MRRVLTRALVGTVVTGAAGRLVFGSSSQQFGPFPYRGSGARRAVALTFDDGPNEPHTTRLLDVLAEKQVRATFFQVGRCAERFPEVTRRLVREGHVLGNHSYSHSLLAYLTDPRQVAEVGRAEQVLSEIAGVRPALYRPPWLCHPPWVLRTVADAGLQVVSGTFCHPLEIFQPAPARLVDGAMRVSEPGAIVIMHDGREAQGGDRAATVAAVGPLIDRLRAQDYELVTVSELLGAPAYR
jgi:peptidoglycan/xylan/chitin deacetylase (PgdA/CDA1 family)